MLEKKNETTKNQAFEVLAAANITAYLLAVAVFIINLPANFSFSILFLLLPGVILPAAGFIFIEDYFINLSKKKVNFPGILSWNIFKIAALFLLITYVVFTADTYLLYSIYIIPVVVGAITFGRLGGMFLAGAASLLLFFILQNHFQGLEMIFNTVFLFASILFLVAWLVGSIIEIERKTNKKLELLFEERQKMEGEMLKANKLESISLLAGGVAHDFNNFLAVILGNVSLAKSLKDREKIKKRLESIEKIVSQARDLTFQLQIYSKGEISSKKTICMRELAKEVVDFTLSGTRVSCRDFFPNESFLVEVDKSQISQVLNNIIINAVQSMPGGGTIVIEGETIENNEAQKDALPLLASGLYRKISISDSGHGIAQKDLPRIFDPFFSTKVDGSGLGLAISHSIIQKHKGAISVESEMGVGTTFHIYLPAALGLNLQKMKKRKVFTTRKGRILVIDDKETLRQIAGEMLNSLGYESEFAGNGSEAVKLCQQAKEKNEPYLAAIIDLTIPGSMGGERVVEELKKIDAQISAIVSSGFRSNPIIENYELYGFDGCIIKPYSMEELAKTLEEVTVSKTAAN